MCDRITQPSMRKRICQLVYSLVLQVKDRKYDTSRREIARLMSSYQRTVQSPESVSEDLCVPAVPFGSLEGSACPD